MHTVRFVLTVRAKRFYLPVGSCKNIQIEQRPNTDRILKERMTGYAVVSDT